MGTFIANQHLDYILHIDEDLAMFLNTQHLRMGGLYWGITALDLLQYNHSSKRSVDKLSMTRGTSLTNSASCSFSRLHKGDEPAASLSEHHEEEIVKLCQGREEVVEWIVKCQNGDGGFGPSLFHDSHITSTHYAVLVLCVYDVLDRIDVESAAHYIQKLQSSEDGSFAGDEWGETDARFTYCALACLTILRKIDIIHVDAAADYLLRCSSYDGGFSSIPGAESHAAYTFCCVSGLTLCGRLNGINKDSLGWWLCERQTPSGGFNGRPEKFPDVCYSWWILSALMIIGRLDWIDQDALTSFILQAQDPNRGGIADRPNDEVDIFHTFFGVAALALMRTVTGLKDVNPVFALPSHVVCRMGLPCC